MNAESPESCIAIHPLELAHRLSELDPGSVRGFQGWFQIRDDVAEAIHQQIRTQFKPLVVEYPFFDPDHDHPSGFFSDPKRGSQNRSGMILEALDALLCEAKYRRLQPAEISRALQTATAWGLKLNVRFKDFRRLRVYARGNEIESRSRREWYLLFRRRHLSVPVYRQLVVVFEPRARNENDKASLCLRMFKNVPHADLDMLLPGTVRIHWTDSGRIGIPTLWGFAMLVSKLARNLWLLAIFGAVKVLTSLTFIVAVIIAAAIYGVKVFFSYRHARNRHLLNVTRNLYYQTLSNNSGVLLRLMDEAEQQQTSQALLVLYAIERSHPEPMPLEEIDCQCEALIARLAMGAINFDVREAVEFLWKMGFVESVGDSWILAGKIRQAI
ncbi:MAG: DUF3754 domain-containing protein [Planctomycetota bacterium]|jgi:hypothetical protein